MPNPNDEDTIQFLVSPEQAGKRVDQVIAHELSEYSRGKIQQWIKSECILLDGDLPKSKQKVWAGQEITIDLKTALSMEEVEHWKPQALPLDIVFEDEDIIIINKPASVVVHPGAGNKDNTLVNALLNYAPELNHLPRAGIIHRIDKDTTGLLVIARNLISHNALTKMLQAREFNRQYQALVNGVMTAGGTIDAPMGRHPQQRTKMAVLLQNENAKNAITHYRVETRYRAHTLVNVKLETGRTHQIRVHMAHIKYPIVGDPVYGGRFRIPPGASEKFIKSLNAFKRQALHAKSLGFEHPVKGEYMEWQVPLPEDFQLLLTEMAEDFQSHLNDE